MLNGTNESTSNTKQLSRLTPMKHTGHGSHIVHTESRKIPRCRDTEVGVRRAVKVYDALLENVTGLIHEFYECFVAIIEAIRAIGDPIFGGQAFSVFFKVVNSIHYKLAQHRERVYIVAIRRCGRSRVHFECTLESSEAVGLHTVWDAGSVALRALDKYPFPQCRLAVRNIQQCLLKVLEHAAIHNIGDPSQIAAVVDTQSAKLNMRIGGTPCLTKARGGTRAFFSIQHARFLTISELMRLQGVPTNCAIRISPRQMGMALGNAFSVPVLRAIIAAAIEAAERS